jgi:membrane protease subunit (stomatin/prohibitin family)
MGLFNWAKNQFIDIIEWLDDTQNTIVYRYPRQDNEIKYNEKLVVRESQAAVFINMGKIADVFTPGTYTLETKNLPILADLQGWKYGFESPFKAEVYFVNTKRFTDLKWGTKAPVMLRDKEFGPVRLRAFGTYVMKIKDPGTFVKEISGTDGNFTTDGIINQLKNIATSRFADTLGESKIPILDLAANYDELGDFILKKIFPEFETYGIELTKFLIENISLPQAVEEALDKRSSMGVIGNLNQYTQYQTANAMEDAAQNPGGMASGGMGMGMGFAMANQMGQAIPNQNAGQSAPPPIPKETAYFIAVDGNQTGPFTLTQLKEKVTSKELTKATLAWKEGMSNWEKAENIAELVAILGSIPPPLPKQ